MTTQQLADAILILVTENERTEPNGTRQSGYQNDPLKIELGLVRKYTGKSFNTNDVSNALGSLFAKGFINVNHNGLIAVTSNGRIEYDELMKPSMGFK